MGTPTVSSRLRELVGKRALLKIRENGRVLVSIEDVQPPSDFSPQSGEDGLQAALQNSQFTVTTTDLKKMVVSGRQLWVLKMGTV